MTYHKTLHIHHLSPRPVSLIHTYTEIDTHVVVSVVALDAKNERVSAQVWMVGRRNISLTETSADLFSWTSASMTCSLTQ